MKKFIYTLLILISCSAYSQDTLTIKGNKYYKGQELKLSYGSDANKNFVFVWRGSGFKGLKKLPSDWSNVRVTTEEIIKGYNGKYWAKCKPQNPPYVMGGDKIYIDIEGAIEFKEVQNGD